MTTYHPLYKEFFKHYHQAEYWEAHEVLEELWQQDRSNDFYHGLIQVAAIMHQLVRGKVLGARKLATTAIRYLQPYPAMHEGVDLAEVRDWLQLCLDTLPTGVQRIEVAEVEKLEIPICRLPVIK